MYHNLNERFVTSSVSKMLSVVNENRSISWSAREEGQGDGGDDIGQAAAEAKGETRGAFLGAGEAWSFDNSFFGIPPAQASCMDPQQRMMLEVTRFCLITRGDVVLPVCRGARPKDAKKDQITPLSYKGHINTMKNNGVISGRSHETRFFFHQNMLSHLHLVF